MSPGPEHSQNPLDKRVTLKLKSALERKLEPHNEQLEIAQQFDWTLQAANISPNDMRALCCPGVYIFWQKTVQTDYYWKRAGKDTRGEIALYIGSSRRTICRMANPKHEKAQKALREATRIEIRFCKTEAYARELEAELIAFFQPLYNVMCKKNGQK